MRSYRYKYSTRTAYMSLLIRVEGGWNYTYSYQMKKGKGDLYFYSLKHYDVDTITRIYWTFANDFDKKNLTFSKMVREKRRCCKKYFMCN